MILDKDKFINHCIDQKFLWARVMTPSRELFAMWECKDTDEFIGKINTLASNYPTMWHFLCKKGPTYHENTICRMDVKLGEAPELKHLQQQQPENKLQGMPVLNVQDDTKIQEKIQQAVQQQLEQIEQRREIERLKEQLKQNNNHSNKFASLVELLLQRLTTAKPQPQVKLAGTEAEQARAITPEEKKKWQEGLILFSQHTDADTFLNIAKKVNENPIFIQQVKTFLNV